MLKKVPKTKIENSNVKKEDSWPQTLTTYLGQKGYTLLKSDLSISQQIKLKEHLMVKPYVPGSPVQLQKTFPVYRESDKKIYIPRYFGTELFGAPKTLKITEGSDINVEFKGTLRDHQVPVTAKYLEHVKINGGGGGLLELPCGFGKCLGFGTLVLMFDGKLERVENIKVGDLLMGDNSMPRRVLSLARGREQMYKIKNLYGDEYVCNESHILSLKYKNNNNSIIDISVKDYLDLPKFEQLKLYGYKVPIQFMKTNKIIDIDPYILGSRLPSNVELPIPHAYKTNSREIRLQVLAGLIDIIGTRCRNYYRIELTNGRNTPLKNDIIYLCRSLGFSCSKKTCRATYCRQNAAIICVYGDYLAEIPVLKSENIYITKQLKETDSLLKPKQLKEGMLKGTSFANPRKERGFKPRKERIFVEKLKEDDYYGFEIDGNRRFVLGDFSVTHNTSIGLYLCSQLKKKTLVIVHKEFLMNQWIERIQQFMPEAKVGKLQGQIVDIEGKDIVLAMLQSLSMKDYPASLFDSFGLTIIDEVHHISSEVFSCALFKLVTKYMLGLSATMNRKDGTTEVFKMFLGEVLFKMERSKDEEVLVRGITYESNDDEYNKLELDFRGQTAASTMLSKICNYNRRSEFILRVLKDMLVENPKQQIMIIASYRNILEYFHQAITHHSICSVGYYVGGMKEAALKLSESKQVVLATYSMAAEGLDIKSLTTLMMITPMTSIEQAVGRILREKHDFAPVVVDIIDTHDNFQRQWQKRKAFYKKNNYKIIQTRSSNYSADTSNWVTTNNVTKNNLNKTTNKMIKDNKIDDSDIESDSDSKQTDKNTAGVCLLKFTPLDI
jgi:superfamily II DNA or RNA helicase